MDWEAGGGGGAGAGDAADCELTSRFLNGEISFEEYSLRWYERAGEPGDEEEGDGEGHGEESAPGPSQPQAEREGAASTGASASAPRRRRRTHLSPALLGLMGEANLRYVRGDLDAAERMCREIIRQVPNASEPYQTLAQIHEADPDKYLQFALLAAHLSPPDADEWTRLAEILKRRKDYKQEMICYTQAIKADPQCLQHHLRRIKLLDELESMSYPTQTLRINYQLCYHKIVKSLHPSEAQTILSYAKKAAAIYHNSKEMEKALEVMRDAYEKCASLFTMEDLNLLLELLISQKHYQSCVEVLIANAGVEIEADVHMISEGDQVREQTQYIKCHMPSTLPIDLKTKLLVCFIHLKANDIVNELTEEFLKNDVEKTGDLYMDIEEALTSVDEHGTALRFLEPLIHSAHFSLGAVWLKHAECLIKLGRDSEAVESLRKVIELAPQHVDARRKLYNILLKLGQTTEAEKSLQQDYTGTVNATLMYEHCCILKERNQLAKFLEVGQLLLTKNYLKFRHPEELKMARLLRSVNSVADNIYNFRRNRHENPNFPDDLVFDSEDNLTPETEWELCRDLLTVAYNFGNYAAMQRLSFGALTSKIVSQQRSEIDFICIQSCLLNKDYRNAFPIVRDLMLRKSEYPRVWNLFNLIIQNLDDVVPNKVIERLFNKGKRSARELSLFIGNGCLSAGRYQTALRYYLEYYEYSSSSFAALLVGLTLFIMACQKFVDKHHSLILQGMSFLLIYKRLRNIDQESYYNIGRAFHMLSINNLAIHYYEKALAAPSMHCDDHNFVSVQKEAAFNLYVLYKNNSPGVARMIMQKYLVI